MIEPRRRSPGSKTTSITQPRAGGNFVGRRTALSCDPIRRTAGRASLLLLVFALGVACACAAEDATDAEPSVTPYRPTVSNPADLSAPGWLEGEFGGLHTANEDHSRNDSVPWVLKYAFDENYGVLIGGNAYASSRVPGVAETSGLGDTSIEWKQRFPIADKAAFGIEAGVVLPTAARDLGVGKPEWLANGIFSCDLGALHLDLNLGAARFAEHPVGASVWQSAWAAALSTSLTDKFGAAFELSGTRQSGIPTQSLALLAFNYNVSNRLVLDAGAAYGLTRDAHDRSLFAGATVLLGRLREVR